MNSEIHTINLKFDFSSLLKIKLNSKYKVSRKVEKDSWKKGLYFITSNDKLFLPVENGLPIFIFHWAPAVM